ncbi:hypothetical protein L1887_20698 [Cichorium endivia]|nr:hypothetical protein L1887_20698 [Cichorium endivia]
MIAFLNMDLRCFPDLEKTEHWQLMLFAFFEEARQMLLGATKIVSLNQGYMPSDLYNLKSAYGTQVYLKYCIEEMHNQHLLAKEEEIEKKKLEVRKRVEAQLGRIEEETRKSSVGSNIIKPFKSKL